MCRGRWQKDKSFHKLMCRTRRIQLPGQPVGCCLEAFGKKMLFHMLMSRVRKINSLRLAGVRKYQAIFDKYYQKQFFSFENKNKI